MAASSFCTRVFHDPLALIFAPWQSSFSLAPQISKCVVFKKKKPFQGTDCMCMPACISPVSTQFCCCLLSKYFSLADIKEKRFSRHTDGPSVCVCSSSRSSTDVLLCAWHYCAYHQTGSIIGFSHIVYVRIPINIMLHKKEKYPDPTNFMIQIKSRSSIWSE